MAARQLYLRCADWRGGDSEAARLSRPPERKWEATAARWKRKRSRPHPPESHQCTCRETPPTTQPSGNGRTPPHSAQVAPKPLLSSRAPPSWELPPSLPHPPISSSSSRKPTPRSTHGNDSSSSGSRGSKASLGPACLSGKRFSLGPRMGLKRDFRRRPGQSKMEPEMEPGTVSGRRRDGTWHGYREAERWNLAPFPLTRARNDKFTADNALAA
jgi:hypothetical protein